MQHSCPETCKGGEPSAAEYPLDIGKATLQGIAEEKKHSAMVWHHHGQAKGSM